MILSCSCAVLSLFQSRYNLVQAKRLLSYSRNAKKPGALKRLRLKMLNKDEQQQPQSLSLPQVNSGSGMMEQFSSKRSKLYNLWKSSTGNMTSSNILPDDMHISKYQMYSFRSVNTFSTQLKFCVRSPGNIGSRKNKLLISLCKQYLKSNLRRDEEVTSSSGESSTSSSNLSFDKYDQQFGNEVNRNELDTLKQRMSGFLARNISEVPVIIDLMDDYNNMNTTFHVTDQKGDVDVKLDTKFLPTMCRVTLDTPSNFEHEVSVEYPLEYVKSNGVALISDIDDTIKHTGVTGDKRSLFRNVFVNDIKTWLISDMSLWYNTLRDTRSVDFFYVSNAPLQLYDTIAAFVNRYYPVGPMYLKEYSGSLLASLMASSANKKLNSITKILETNPSKKFILVGDSGEQDFEAYISTALAFPEQIIAIYIRCCKNSLSDAGLNEVDVMKDLNALIREQYVKPINMHDSSTPGLKKTRPLPPIVPPKTLNLTQTQLETIRVSRTFPSVRFRPPPPTSPSKLLSDTLPPLPRRRTSHDNSYYVPSTQNDYNTYDGYFDKKADTWHRRVSLGIKQLLEMEKYNLGLMFFHDTSMPLEDSIRKIDGL